MYIQQVISLLFTIFAGRRVGFVLIPILLICIWRLRYPELYPLKFVHKLLLLSTYNKWICCPCPVPHSGVWVSNQHCCWTRYECFLVVSQFRLLYHFLVHLHSRTRWHVCSTLVKLLVHPARLFSTLSALCTGPFLDCKVLTVCRRLKYCHESSQADFQSVAGHAWYLSPCFTSWDIYSPVLVETMALEHASDLGVFSCSY